MNRPRSGAAPSLLAGAIALALSLVGCTPWCSGDNGKMCGSFPAPVLITQDSPRLHFTAMSVSEGTCEPPACHDAECTALRFIGAALPSVPDTSPDEPLPDARCRFDVSTDEGPSLDVALRLSRINRLTVCCCTGTGQPCNAARRELVGYSWSVSVNGVVLGIDTVTLPATWDGGAASVDGDIRLP